ncbi:MAG: twin-arginine translocase TatA/TatE family subunit [Anaerolineae bacterium]
MEFLNVGASEILVIALIALILFGPEDIVKMMRKLGEYTRKARVMWNQFSATIQEEYSASEELTEIIDGAKASVAEVQTAVDEIKKSVGEISSSVEKDVTEAQKAMRTQAEESAQALKKAGAGLKAIDGVPSWRNPPPRSSTQTEEEPEQPPKTAPSQSATAVRNAEDVHAAPEAAVTSPETIDVEEPEEAATEPPEVAPPTEAEIEADVQPAADALEVGAPESAAISLSKDHPVRTPHAAQVHTRALPAVSATAMEPPPPSSPSEAKPVETSAEAVPEAVLAGPAPLETLPDPALSQEDV